jgi:hypothetical protein
MTSDAQEPQSPPTGWTLGAIKRRGLELEGYCQGEGCRNFYTFSLGELIDRAGPDYLLPEILPGITCTACGGSLRAKLAMLPPGDAADTPAHTSEVDERIGFFEAQAEEAYSKMYEANGLTAAAGHYSNAKEALHDAIGLTSGIDDSATRHRLQTRLAHIKAVFRSQFS